jgi:cytidylate kinase
MVVTIDGPAGSGKSSAARGLADRLRFDYLDTGAMYRAIALALARLGIDLSDLPAVEPALAGVRVEALSGRVILNGEEVSGLIRTPEVSQGASRVAVIPSVRQFLVAEQRRAAAGRDIICEGRDQGTVVFPDAECKFFLTADPAARAARRHQELMDAGDTTTTLAEVLRAQEERDARDASRDLSPMRPAKDAVIVDTTHLTSEGVLAQLEQEVARRCPPART